MHPPSASGGSAALRLLGLSRVRREKQQPGRPTRRYSGLTLAVIMAVQLMIIMDATVVTVALPTIRTALGFSPTGLAWVMDAYTLVFGGLLLLGGRTGDLFGRRRMLVAGVTVFGLASLAGGLATGPGMLLAARALQGVGAAMAAPSALALIVTNFDGPARVRAIAAYSSVSGAGSSVGMILGGVLTSYVSWRWIMFINVPIGLAVVILAPLVIAEAPRNPVRLDIAGALTATGGVGALAYGFLHASTAGWRDAGTITAFAVALALLVAFVAIEARIGHPLLPPRLLADRTRAGGYAVMLLLPAAMFGMFYFVAQYLGLTLRYDALRTGLAFLPFTVLTFVTARSVPRLITRYGARPVMVVGLLLMAAGLAWLTRLHSSYLSVLGPTLLLGLGVGASFVPNSATILARVTPADSGAAAGVLQAAQQLGGAVGLAVLVTVFGAAGGAASFVRGATAAFAVGTGIVALAVLVVVLVMRPGRQAGSA